MAITIFVIKLLIDFYLYILLLRLFFQKYRAPFYNPICQFVVRVTNPLLKPTSRFIPGYRGFDLAIVAWLLVLQTLLFFFLIWFSSKIMPHVLGIVIMAVGKLGEKWLDLIFFAILIDVVISWFPALRNSMVAPIVELLAEPWLLLGRRFIPVISGFDFSPLVILLLLKIISWLVFYPMVNLGLRLALIT